MSCVIIQARVFLNGTVVGDSCFSEARGVSSLSNVLMSPC